MSTGTEKAALKFGESMIRGRIEGSRRFEGKVYTRLVQPAASAYDKPSINEVVSPASLGGVGDEITILVRIGGYPRKAYDFTDRATGEVRRVQPIENTLQFVDFC